MPSIREYRKKGGKVRRSGRTSKEQFQRSARQRRGRVPKDQPLPKKRVSEVAAFRGLLRSVGADQAYDYYQKTPHLQEDPFARTLMATALYENGRLEEASEIYKYHISKNTGDKKARQTLGGIYIKLGRSDLAEEQYRSILTQDPNDYYALRSLGMLKLNMDAAEDAITFLSLAFSTNEDNIDLRCALARAHKLGKDYEACHELLKEHVCTPELGVNNLALFLSCKLDEEPLLPILMDIHGTKEVTLALTKAQQLRRHHVSEAKKPLFPESGKIYIFSDEALKGRRRLEAVSIDSANSRWKDDAISIETLEGNKGWIVQVNIADVASEVDYDSPFYKSVIKSCKANGSADIYFQKPESREKLRILSLEEGFWRPTITVEMHIDTDLNLTQKRIFPSACMNKQALTFEEVHDKVQEGDKVFVQWVDLARKLRKKKLLEGAIAFYGLASRAHLEPVKQAIPDYTKENHGKVIVLELTSLANRVIAADMLERNMPGLYINFASGPIYGGVFSLGTKRVEYNIETLEQAREMGHKKGTLEEIKERIKFWLEPQRYGPNPETGFGNIIVPEYTHFTSPLRRLPDFVTHQIRAQYRKNNPVYNSEITAELCSVCNAEIEFSLPAPVSENASGMGLPDFVP